MQGCGVVDEQSGVGTMTCGLASHPTFPPQTCCLCFQLCQTDSANRRPRLLLQSSHILRRVGCGGELEQYKSRICEIGVDGHALYSLEGKDTWHGSPFFSYHCRSSPLIM